MDERQPPDDLARFMEAYAEAWNTGAPVTTAGLVVRWYRLARRLVADQTQR